MFNRVVLGTNMTRLHKLCRTQNWEIECNQCNPGASSSPGGGEFAVGCSVKSIPSGLCVQLEHTTDIIGLGQCSGAPSETFDFWTTTAV